MGEITWTYMEGGALVTKHIAPEDFYAPPIRERSNRRSGFERQANDWYVEEPWQVDQLFEEISFGSDTIWDPACGSGTTLEAARRAGYRTIATDLVDRGYARMTQQLDFLATDPWTVAAENATVSLVFNPPYGRLVDGMPKGDTFAERFIRHALPRANRRVAALLPVGFLAGQYRGRAGVGLFQEFPPSHVLILSERGSMPPGVEIARLEREGKAFKGGTTDFCWIVWTPPHDRETITRWLAPRGRGNDGRSARSK